MKFLKMTCLFVGFLVPTMVLGNEPDSIRLFNYTGLNNLSLLYKICKENRCGSLEQKYLMEHNDVNFIALTNKDTLLIEAIKEVDANGEVVLDGAGGRCKGAYSAGDSVEFLISRSGKDILCW